MMVLFHRKGCSMSKTLMLVLISVLPVLAAAQAPASKSKTVNKVAAKPKMSASEEATAAAQAAAIAQAAGPTASMSAAPAVAAAMPALPAPVQMVPAPSGHEGVSTEELAIAKRVHQGVLPCELGASIRVESDAAQPGYFNLQGKGFRYRMRPVVTSTGAIRLEDQKAGAVWLQLANKSMLMDQKKGRRVADECAHPDQMAYAENMKTNPPPKLFDTTGMGR